MSLASTNPSFLLQAALFYFDKQFPFFLSQMSLARTNPSFSQTIHDLRSLSHSTDLLPRLQQHLREHNISLIVPSNHFARLTPSTPPRTQHWSSYALATKREIVTPISFCSLKDAFKPKFLITHNISDLGQQTEVLTKHHKFVPSHQTKHKKQKLGLEHIFLVR